MRSSTQRVTVSSTISPCEPRTTIRLVRSGLCHWLSVKSYSALRPSPKSSVARMFHASTGSVAPVQPSRASGLEQRRGDAVARHDDLSAARAEQPSDQPDRVVQMRRELICTLVGVPISPASTTAIRAACDGIDGLCSATWTSPDEPTSAHSSRSPSASGAGGVSASTGMPSSTSSRIASGVTGHGTETTTNSGRSVVGADGGDELLDGAHRRHAPRRLDLGATLRRPRDHADALEPLRHQRAMRTKNSARHPLPTTPNRMGACAIGKPSSPSRATNRASVTLSPVDEVHASCASVILG